MPKIRIKLTIESEYPLVPESYPGMETHEEMLKNDIEQAKDDPYLMLEMHDSKISVTGELVPDDSDSA